MDIASCYQIQTCARSTEVLRQFLGERVWSNFETLRLSARTISGRWDRDLNSSTAVMGSFGSQVQDMNWRERVKEPRRRLIRPANRRGLAPTMGATSRRLIEAYIALTDKARIDKLTGHSYWNRLASLAMLMAVVLPLQGTVRSPADLSLPKSFSSSAGAVSDAAIMTIGILPRSLYRGAATSRNVQGVKHGRVGQRIVRRTVGRSPRKH
jgi:hypothetical protein